MSGGFLNLLERLVRTGVNLAIVGGYEQVRRSSEIVTVEGTKLRVLTIGALIKTKEAMHRPRDREAIRQLKAIEALKRDQC